MSDALKKRNYYKDKLEQERNDRCEEVADFKHESNTKIRDLEEDLKNMTEARDYYKEKYNDYQQGHKVTPRHMPEVKVIVNGQRYNVI